MLISVIIPVYQTEKYLQDCVNSVLSQTYNHYEIILVDDGSLDGSPAICDELCATYPCIRTIHQPNAGLSAARNSGLLAAKGDAILFLDSDDTIDSNTLFELYSLMSDDVDAVLPTCCLCVYEDGSTSKCLRYFPIDMANEEPSVFTCTVMLGAGRAWAATTVLYRRSVIGDAVVFPNGKIAEDIVFNMRFMRNARKIRFVDRPLQHYTQRIGSISHTFQPKFADTIAYIDSVAQEYVSNAAPDSFGYVDTLLVRNVIIYAISVYSSSNPASLSQKKAIVAGLFSDKRTLAAAKTHVGYPFFDSFTKRFFMRIMFFLLKHRLFANASVLARLAAGRLDV